MGSHTQVLALLLVFLASSANAIDLSLNEAITIALTRNYEQLDRIDDVALAELDFGNVRSNYRTKFRASGNSNAVNGAELGSYYGIGVSKENLSGSRYAAGFYNSTYGQRSLSELRFSYTLPFFNRGKREANQLELDKAEMGVARRERLVAIAAEELASEVTAAYYKVLLTSQRAEMVRDQAAITAASLERAKIRMDAGELAMIKYEQAGLRLSRAQQTLLQAEFQEQLATDRLKLLLAMDIDERLNLTSKISAPDAFALLEIPVEALENKALIGRQELLGQREELSLARRRIRNLGDRNLPDFDIDLQYSLIGEGNRFDDSFAFDDQQWGIGLRMDTDFGARERRTRRSRMHLRVQSMQRSLDALEQKVRVEVRGRHFDLARAAQTLDIAERGYAITEKATEQSRILAERGQLSDMDVLESELELSESQYQVRAARAELALAMHELKLAIGGVE